MFHNNKGLVLSNRLIYLGRIVCLFAVIWFLHAPFNSCSALEPDEILVIANRNAARSVGLAKYYMKKRKIPEENLIKLWVTDNETCSRVDYEKKVGGLISIFYPTGDVEKDIEEIKDFYRGVKGKYPENGVK